MATQRETSLHSRRVCRPSLTAFATRRRHPSAERCRRQLAPLQFLIGWLARWLLASLAAQTAGQLDVVFDQLGLAGQVVALFREGISEARAGSVRLPGAAPARGAPDRLEEVRRTDPQRCLDVFADQRRNRRTEEGQVR